MHIAQALVLARMLTGKLLEGWDLVRGGFYATRLGEVYEPLMGSDGRAAAAELKRYFGRRNLVATVRNKFAFHYDLELVRAQFEKVQDSNEWEILLSDSNANTLFHVSEIVVGHAMLDAIQPGNHQAALDRLIDETKDLVGWFGRFIAGYSVAVLERQNHTPEATAIDHSRNIVVRGAPSFRAVRLPPFVQTRDEERSS